MQIPIGPTPAAIKDLPPSEPFSNAFFALGFSLYVQLAVWNLPWRWREFIGGWLSRRAKREAGNDRRQHT